MSCFTGLTAAVTRIENIITIAETKTTTLHVVTIIKGVNPNLTKLQREIYTAWISGK